MRLRRGKGWRKGTNWWRKWESLISSRVHGKEFSVDGARTPLWWEGKVDTGKFIGRTVGSLASSTYSYFKKVFSSSSE